MLGPQILARTISNAAARGKTTKAWQYHSRSDAHSKVACWTTLFDLVLGCDVLRNAAGKGQIGFRINHVMVGPINKTLDLVLTRVPPNRKAATRGSFAGLVEQYGIVLTEQDRAVLASLPAIEQERIDDVSEVVLALEAKACMTEHIKSLPRLHAEILATGYLAKRAAPRCILASYSLVNAATSFTTPSGSGKVNHHSQPNDAAQVVRMLSTAIPRVGEMGSFGFDAIGVTVLDCRNDGSPVTVIDKAPAPSNTDHVHYAWMISSLCSEYRARFP
jgi:hypothetical protein